jgi:hypothetical protein
LKIILDKNTEFLIRLSDDSSEVLFSSKIKAEDGKIFLTSVSLTDKQIDHLIMALSSVKGKIKKDV